jgi:hypothetical protein
MITLYLLAMLAGLLAAGITATHASEVREMYMLYALEFDLGEYMIITRKTPTPFPLFGTELAWMVPGTISADR